jgi:hypothetical protein
MCGACEDEIFLIAPNPHCVLKGLTPVAPAGAPSGRRFSATGVVDAASPSPVFSASPVLSLSLGRARAAAAASA